MNKELIEKRDFYVKSEIEIRSTEEGKTEFVGFIPYNKRSEFMGFFEVVKPGAFKKTIQEGDIRALVNHDVSKVLGRTKSGTLTFNDTEEGLYFTVPISKRTYSQDLLNLIETGDVDGISFGFMAIKDNVTEDEYGNAVRELLEVRLLEVSLGVTFPAYKDSELSTRDLGTESGIDLIKFGEVIKKFEKKNTNSIEEETRSFLEGISEKINKILEVKKGEDEEIRADEDHFDEEKVEPVNAILWKQKFNLL